MKLVSIATTTSLLVSLAACETASQAPSKPVETVEGNEANFLYMFHCLLGLSDPSVIDQLPRRDAAQALKFAREFMTKYAEVTRTTTKETKDLVRKVHARRAGDDEEETSLKQVIEFKDNCIGNAQRFRELRPLS